MKKRIKKFVLLAAAVACLAAGPQNTLRAAASGASHEDNCDCTLVAHREIDVWEKVSKCTLQEHNSGTCYVRAYWYQEYNVVTCSKCGKEKAREPIGDEYFLREEHFNYCR